MLRFPRPSQEDSYALMRALEHSEDWAGPMLHSWLVELDQRRKRDSDIEQGLCVMVAMRMEGYKKVIRLTSEFVKHEDALIAAYHKFLEIENPELGPEPVTPRRGKRK